MRRGDAVGSLYASIAMLLMGSSVAVSSVIRHYPALGGQAARYALSAAALGLLLRARGNLPRPTLRDLGLLLALAHPRVHRHTTHLVALAAHVGPPMPRPQIQVGAVEAA